MGSDPTFGACRLHVRTSMRVLLILAVTLLAACGPSPEQQAADARDRAGSWAAGIKLAVEAWGADLVPPHYVASTLDAASKDLIEQAAQVRKSAGDAAVRPLDTVTSAIPRLQDAVTRGDRRGARDAAAALTAAVPPPPPPSTQGAAR